MAPSITNYAEIQHDEIGVLRSIYMDDFAEEESKAGAWNKASDRSFSINLRPSFGKEEKVAAITLKASLPPTYPKTLPRLSLEFDEYVRPNTRKQALDVVYTKPAVFQGSEMMYDLTVLLLEVLDNSTKMNLEDVPTLDEERNAKQAALLKAQEAEEKARLKATEVRDAEGTEEEQRLLQEMADQERIRSAQRKLDNLSSEAAQFMVNREVAGGIRFDQPSIIKDPSGKSIEFNLVCDKVFYRKGPAATISTVQIWQEIDESGEIQKTRTEETPFLALKEYFVASAGADERTKKAIQGLETTLDQQTHGQILHPSVIKPINYLIQRSENNEKSPSSSGWKVSVLVELASKGSLFELLELAGQLSNTKKIRAWALQILEGLHHYHRHGAAHASVHLNNVLLEQGEAKNIIAKLSDGVYEQELHLLAGKPPEGLPLSWRVPEHISDKGAASTAGDIWAFGTCLVQMGFGTDIVHEYRSPSAFLDDLPLSKSFAALLRQVFNTSPKKRPSAWDVLHFEFFRNDDALLEHQTSGLNTGRQSITELSSFPLRHSRRDSTADPATSRYTKEFVEDGRLGRGGFGEVFRARNRIDGQLYAVKKIKARSRAALDPVLSEASVLSRLNHPHVVRYYASWIDDSIITEMGDNAESSGEGLSSSFSQFSRGLVLPSSSRGLDFISSNNEHVVFGDDPNDNVVFGEDADPTNHVTKVATDQYSGSESDESSSDTDISTEDDSDVPSTPQNNPGENEDDVSFNLRSPRARRPSRRQVFENHESRTILYIQMEYCRPETLRNVINADIQANSTEGFRLFRQIVQGLAHIHAASIVHRDLKPENIFIDTVGDVRIGDFGLARPGDYRNLDHGGNRTREVLGSFTKDIGTASYVAPEVLSAGGGKYNEKADMYSLGVVFLEMNAVFATGMERAEALESLHKEESALPPTFNAPEKSIQSAIIRSLVQHKPALRPSSSDLLDGGQIPVHDQDETLRMARRLVNDPKSHLRRELIDSLFPDQSSSDQMHDTYGPERGPSQRLELLDDVSAMSRSLPEDLELQAIIKTKLISIFRRHGAVERTDSPVLFPYHPCYPSADIPRFVNPSGRVLQLPYDLVLPNAMLLARAANTGEKRTFIFDNVYRLDAKKDQPNAFAEANFDIISGDNCQNVSIQEAEALKTLDEVLDTFPNLASSHMCYHINHSQLLNFVLRSCDIDEQQWTQVKQILSKLNTGDWNWAKVRHELRAPSFSIAGTYLDELERFDFRDTLDKGITKLRSLLQHTDEIEPTFNHLRNFTKNLTRFGVKRSIYLSPLSSYNERFYKGNILFQCLFDQKRKAVFAAGGRYDHLIRDYQPITTRKNRVHAVGFQMTWSGLSSGMTTYLKAQAKSKSKRRLRQIDRFAWTSRRCEVLVDSFDQDLLATVGIEILKEVWANDISAELAERDHGVPNEYIRADETKEGHGWVVLIKSEDTIKVKNTARKEETEVRLSDLASHLRGEIRERDREEGRTSIAKAPLQRQISQAEPSGDSNDREIDIKVITSQNKGKKVNRKAMVEEARSRAQEWRNASQEYPIVVIETKENVFNSLETTNSQDPESWRKVIQDAPAGERQYLGQIQSALESIQGSSAAFIYNFRTKQIMDYHLGKS